MRQHHKTLFERGMNCGEHEIHGVKVLKYLKIKGIFCVIMGNIVKNVQEKILNCGAENEKHHVELQYMPRLFE